MKKITAILAILALGSPAMAAVTITTSTNSCDGSVNIGYTTDSNLSGFALDITVDDGNIIDINNYHIGESNSTAKGFGIFPGSIDINGTTGQIDDYGSPIADPCLYPGALGGLDTNGITIEMGALYEDGNHPGSAGTLCSVTVSKGCFLTIKENATRGGIVKEDSNDATVTNLPLTIPVPIPTPCPVPNLIGKTAAEANSLITGAGLTVGTINTANHDTIKRNKVSAQNPTDGGNTASCGSPVNYTLSLGCFTSTDSAYSDWLAAGEPNCWCNAYQSNQCYGDGDGQTEGTAKGGYYYVGVQDLQMVFDNWKVLEPPKGSGIVVVGEPNICADYDHLKEGTAKGGYYRVGVNDLQVVFDNWKVLEPPKGSGLPADCP